MLDPVSRGESADQEQWGNEGMRRASQSQPLGTILASMIAVALLLTPGGTAGADDSTDQEVRRIQRAREILGDFESLSSSVSWLQTHIHIRKKRGLEYSHPFTTGNRQLVLNIHGPVMSRKRLGLGFEFRFAPRR